MIYLISGDIIAGGDNIKSPQTIKHLTTVTITTYKNENMVQDKTFSGNFIFRAAQQQL